MTNGVNPKMAAEYEYNMGYRMVSGKIFKVSGTSYSWVSIDDFRHHIMASHYATKASDIQNVLDVFSALYNKKEKWPVPQLWIDACDYKGNVKLKFDFPDKIYKIINLLLTKTGYERFYILYGKAGTGKSTVLNLIKQIFENDVGVFRLSQLCERFTPSEACQYRLITHSELDTNELNSNLLKSIVSMEDGNVERKGQQPFMVKWQSRLIFACNEMPWINLADTGMMRRIVVFKMDKTFQSFDESIRDYQYSRDELLYIIHKALNVDMTNWFEDFRRDTFEALTEHNPVYIFRAAGEYVQYASNCTLCGYKAVNEYHWMQIKQYLREQMDILNIEKR